MKKNEQASSQVVAKQKENLVTKLIKAGVVTALVLLGTFLIKIPTINGYVHLGDGFILSLSMLLGWPAIIGSAVGSALSDLLAGYTVYIAPTFVIKAIMALIVVINIGNINSIKNAYLYKFVVAELAMVVLYFVFEVFVFGLGSATVAILTNLGQAVCGVAIGFILYNALKHIKYFK